MNSQPLQNSKARKVLLVGWEAADWRILHPLIDAGEMPVLRRIIESGASGQLLCTQPMASAAQWSSIVTGKRPWQHGVHHPMEKVTTNGAVPVTASRRRSLALWEMLASEGKRSLVVGWPATHDSRVDNSVVVSDRYAQPTAGPGIKPWPPAALGTYWPHTVGARLDGWRVSPAEIQADIISLLVPEWKKIDQKLDRRLGQLRVFLAADFSHQAAMMTLLSGSQWDFAAVHFPALGAISRIFLAHNPPRQEWVPEEEFALYQTVIRGACRLLDQMLGHLVRAAGNYAAVVIVSGHGVARSAPPPARLRADDDAWKSSHGIFAACGPGVAADALVLGATVLDVAPTLLTWFGLPIGDDMEGRVLLECFDMQPEVARVASWESAQTAPSLAAAQDFGASENPAAAVQLRRESEWNLAQSYLEASRFEKALPILEGRFRDFPERPELGHALFQCQLALRRLPEATETLEVVMEALPVGIWQLLPCAELCIARGQFREARALVDETRQLPISQPEAMRRLGMLLLRLRDWDALADLARHALSLDENDSLAWLGLAEAQLRKRLASDSAESAMRAIGLNYYLHDAHFVLARALVAQGKWTQARDAMQVLRQLQPNNRAAAIYDRRVEQQSRSTY